MRVVNKEWYFANYCNGIPWSILELRIAILERWFMVNYVNNSSDEYFVNLIGIVNEWWIAFVR